MIKSMSNPKIKEYSKLLKNKYIKKHKLFIVEGYHLVEEAKKAGIVEEIITTNQHVGGTMVESYIIKKLTSTKTPQEIVAICKCPEPKEISKKVLALDNIQDPGNLGTLIRTALAFGFTDVIVKGANVYSQKVLRSSQGAFFNINIIQTDDILNYFDNSKTKIGALLDKTAINYKDIEKEKLEEFILVLGNEGNGISEEVQKKLDVRVYIPIKFESLNVAQAGAILINEYQD